MKLLEIPFEHANWSVGRDFDRIREYNPLGRVPTLVTDEGERLMESAAILDYLDERVGVQRALLPRSGRERREALNLMAMATGAAEKGVLQLYERAFRPEDKRHQPWVDRCRLQMGASLAAIDRHLGEHGGVAVAGRKADDSGRHNRGLRVHVPQRLAARGVRCGDVPIAVHARRPLRVAAGVSGHPREVRAACA